MREDILKFLQQDVKEKCNSPNNFFGPDIYYHIGDVEIVTIAAWLHNYASITAEAS